MEALEKIHKGTSQMQNTEQTEMSNMKKTVRDMNL